MHSHRIEILDGAHDHDVIRAIAHELELVLLPADDGFLQQDFSGGTGLQASPGDSGQVLGVVSDTRPGATHRERRSYDHRIPQFPGRGKALLEGVADDGSGTLRTYSLHDRAELLAILTALDGVDICSNELDLVLVEYARFVQRDGGIQSRLAPEGGQQGIGALLGDDALDVLRGDRFDVGGIGELRIGHDRGRIGVHQDHPETFVLEYSACLGTGVVEFASLTDHDRPGADHQNGLDVRAPGH